MSVSYRVQINRIDRSGSLVPNIGSTGAMVLDTVRGPTEPVFVSGGQRQRIIDLFGPPTTSNPDTWDAIQFNNVAPLWLSAPYASGGSNTYLGGVWVTSTGAFPLVDSGGETFQLSQGVVPGNENSAITFAADTEYFVLLSKFPAASNFLKVDVSSDTTATPATFTINLYIKRDSQWEVYDTYKVSLDRNAKGNYGRSIYIEDVFEDHELVQVIPNPDIVDDDGVTVSSFTDTTDIKFNGWGKDSPDASDMVSAWQTFQQSRKYRADIFMSTMADQSIVTEFDNLRNNYQKYSSYILPLPQNEDSSTAADSVNSTKVTYGVNNPGLAFYWNWGKIRYKGRKFMSPLIGRVGTKYAQMTNVFNGLAPSWIDENNHGGQLGPGIEEMLYDPSDDQLKKMDDLGINPIVYDPAYGVMILGQRTAKTPSTISDYSYIAHVRLFDTIIKNVQNQVLTYQITKLNDDIHRQMAISKGETLMEPIVDQNLLTAYQIKCDLQNNDAAARSARQFVYSIAVKVTPFSEFIQFNFINTDQGTSVSEVLA